jgi:hypothetical protein
VDRRVVVSPAQARDLLAAVRGLSGRGGEHLEAFYGCLYNAALRPSEAVMLRESDLHLPKKGWGSTGWLTPTTSGSPDALGVQDTQPESGDEGDDDSEQAS